MNLDEILKKINGWKNGMFSNHYYYSGVFHKETLELLKLDTLKELEGYLVKLKPINQIDLKSDIEYLKLEKEERELNTRYNQDKKGIYTGLEKLHSYSYGELRSDIHERKKPYIEIANKDQLVNKAYEEMFKFFFPFTFEDEVLTNFDRFIFDLRETNNRTWRRGKLVNHWSALVSKALSYPNYEKMEYWVEEDYQILSAYLISLQNALNFNSFRVDEIGRVHLDLKNSIIATLTITELPIKTEFNDFELGERIETQAVGNSGYNNNFYVLSHLNLYFEGHQLHFSFQAYAVLSNGFHNNLNSSARLGDEIKEIWEN